MSKFQLESNRYKTYGWFIFSEIRRSFRLSTVELPLGHGYETCVFDNDRRYCDVVGRYDTEAEAILGHFEHMKRYGLTSVKKVV